LNLEELDEETIDAVIAVESALDECQRIRLYSVTSDTEYGMTTQLFPTEKAQLEWMNNLMKEDAEEQGMPQLTIGSPEWHDQWENWKEAQSMDSDYYSIGEHDVDLAEAQPVAPPSSLFRITPGIIPPDTDGRNLDRASWASACIKLFMRTTGVDEEDAVHDLITDLAHWCDRKGMDFNQELRLAAMHYADETREPVEGVSRL
jgi:hypothetical protein